MDKTTDPMNMFAPSVGFHQHSESNLNPMWGISPPLFQHKGPKANKIRTLKKMCRQGIPPTLRLAIWLTSTIRISRPDQSTQETYEYALMRNVEVLSHSWDIILKNLFPNYSDEENLEIPPNFGCSPNELKAWIDKISGDKEFQEIRVYKLLHALLYQLGIDFCLLLPAITSVFLSAMPESHAYSAIREMNKVSNYYFPISKTEHYKWCKTFSDLTRRLYPKTAVGMEASGALTPTGLDPIFRMFFITILKREDVFRIMDMYTVEGYKTLLRIGILILNMCRKYMKVSDFKDVQSFWKGVERVAHSDKFDIDVLINQTYGNSRYYSRQAFPTREFITKLMEYNEEWALQYRSDEYLETNLRPLGLIEGDNKIKLAEQSSARLAMAEFLPFSLRNTKLDLIYTSDEHGRTLDSFYSHCAKAKHTVMLIEVLQTGAIVGMFATDTWQISQKVYGDGGCMLFRLEPNAVCYHWSNEVSDGSEDIEHSESNRLVNEVLMSQFMISKADFIAMGCNEDGSNGLRINEDFTKGSSAKARGFNNEPLAGEEFPDFDLGLIEVYRFVREVDGKPVDGEGEIWKDMFD